MNRESDYLTNLDRSTSPKMAGDEDDFTAEFTFTWEIENFSWCLPWKWVKSPTFVVESLDNTQWCLHLWPKEYTNGIHIEFYLCRESEHHGPERIDVEFELSFLDAYSSALTRKSMEDTFEKDDFKGFTEFVEQYLVFNEKSGMYLPGDTLTACCKMRRAGFGSQPLEPEFCFASSYIKVERSFFRWVIEEFSTLQPGDKRTILVQTTLKDKPSVSLTLYLTGRPDEEEVQIEITHDQMNKPNMTKCEISVMDGTGNAVASKTVSSCLEGEIWKFPTFIARSELMEDEDTFLQNDELTLKCELTISVGVTCSDINFYRQNSLSTAEEDMSEEDDEDLDEEEELLTTANSLKEDLKCYYENRTFSDINLIVGTEVFPAHRLVLSLQSSVFKEIFENDTTNKDIELKGIDADVLRQMLLFIYTDTVEDFSWDSATKLYLAAESYQLLSLKQRCSKFLKGNIDTSNACSILTLAEEHHDANLTKLAQDYILQHGKELINSNEWKEFKKKNIEFAFEVMQLMFLEKVEK